MGHWFNCSFGGRKRVYNLIKLALQGVINLLKKTNCFQTLHYPLFLAINEIITKSSGLYLKQTSYESQTKSLWPWLVEM